MKHRLITAFIFIMFLALCLTGCDLFSSTPDKAVKDFISSYSSSSVDKFAEVSKQDGDIFEETSKLISSLGYDEKATKNLSEEMKDISLEVLETKEKEKTATVDAKITYKELSDSVYNDIAGYIAKKEKPDESKSFENANKKEENIKVYLVKKEDSWLVDLTDERNKKLVNAICGGLVSGSENLFNVDKVDLKKEPVKFPGNTIKFTEAGKTAEYNVNPQLPNGHYIPFYAPLSNANFIVGWKDESDELRAIKSNKVDVIPFEKHKVAFTEINYPNMKKITSNEMKRENIGTTDTSYCNIELCGMKSKDGQMPDIMEPNNNLYMVCGIYVMGDAGSSSEYPIEVYVDGDSIGKIQIKGSSDGYFDEEVNGNVRYTDFLSLNDKQAKIIQKKGNHLIEFVQLNENREIVFYQTMPYTIKSFE